jgi:hypothetical protein
MHMHVHTKYETHEHVCVCVCVCVCVNIHICDQCYVYCHAGIISILYMLVSKSVCVYMHTFTRLVCAKISVHTYMDAIRLASIYMPIIR